MPYGIRSLVKCSIAVSCLMLANETLVWRTISLAAHKNESSSSKQIRDDLGSVTPEREAAALKFVELHHPALVSLLSALKSAGSPQYEKAIQEIFRDSERLARSKDRNSKRYELELDSWKINSRVNLLTASLAMAADPEEILQEIRDLLIQKQALELTMLENEVTIAQKRLEKLISATEKIRQEQNAILEKQLERIRYSADQMKKRNSTSELDSNN